MANIKVKLPSGEVQTYEGVERVWLDSADDAEATVPFTHGLVTELDPVELALGDGDQTVTVPDGQLLTEITIQRPETLLPENIRQGAEVAGVAGEFIGDTEEQTLELAMADGDMVVEPSEAGKVLSKVTILKPETLVPENIPKGMYIAGVGPGTMEAELDDILRYFDVHIDAASKIVTITAIHYDLLYEDYGSYDVTIPDTINGLSVVLSSE